MSDLFGHAMPPAERRKALGIKRGPQPKGYFAAPGTGPEGETCRTCKHATAKRMSKTYWKCGKASARWTGGLGSDIRLKSPACVGWEE